MKSNAILFMILAYISIIGVNVKVINPIVSKKLGQCEPLPEPVISPPPVLPTIDKEYLDNKDYVIRILIKHIHTQNDYVTTVNKQTTDVYNLYTKCTME